MGNRRSGLGAPYMDPSVDNPVGITAGPDGALWFTNAANNSIGRIPTVSRYATPTIFNVSPISGAVGQKVIINGLNLARATRVTFNGTRAVIKKATFSQIEVKVPPRATSGHVTVTTPGGTVTSDGSFRVTRCVLRCP